MSYILDALKRSDRSRQVNTTHEMSYSHLHKDENHENLWLKVLVAALSLALLSVLAFVFFTNKYEQEAPYEVRVISTQAESSASEAQSNRQSIDNEKKILVEQAPAKITNSPEPLIEKSLNTIQSASNSVEREAQNSPRRSLSELVEPAKSLENSDSKLALESISPEVVPKIILSSEIEAQLPIEDLAISRATNFSSYDNYSEIRASQNLPELHLDILMYHPNTSQRKAFINMQAYEEGGQISEGAELLEIGEKGVLLRYQGKDFVLSTK